VKKNKKEKDEERQTSESRRYEYSLTNRGLKYFIQVGKSGYNVFGSWLIIPYDLEH